MHTTELEVVNACLATMGETPLNTLEDDHSYKAAALSYLAQVNKIEQKVGWWYNSEYILLTPDVSGYIYVPTDALSIKTIDRMYTPAYAQRGNRLYNVRDNSYEWPSAFWIDLVRLIAFNDLPYHAADLVHYGTVMRFQREFDGDNTRYSQLSQDYSRARMELRAEDTRNRRPNLLATENNIYNMARIGGFSHSAWNRLPYTPGWPR